MKQETLTEVVRAAPPVSVGGLTLWGVPLSEWVLILTAVYTIFLIVDKFPVVVERLGALLKKLRGK